MIVTLYYQSLILHSQLTRSSSSSLCYLSYIGFPSFYLVMTLYYHFLILRLYLTWSSSSSLLLLSCIRLPSSYLLLPIYLYFHPLMSVFGFVFLIPDPYDFLFTSHPLGIDSSKVLRYSADFCDVLKRILVHCSQRYVYFFSPLA